MQVNLNLPTLFVPADRDVQDGGVRVRHDNKNGVLCMKVSRHSSSVRANDLKSEWISDLSRINYSIHDFKL